MSKATWDEELTVVILGELYGYMLTISWASLADVYGNVEHGTFDTTHKLALCEWWCLKVQASHDAIAAHGFVVLHEVDFSHFFFEFSL